MKSAELSAFVIVIALLSTEHTAGANARFHTYGALLNPREDSAEQKHVNKVIYREKTGEEVAVIEDVPMGALP